MQRLVLLLTVFAATIAATCEVATAQTPKPPCSALVSRVTLQHAFALGSVQLYREGELPSFVRGSDGSIQFTCAYQLWSGQRKPRGGNAAFIEIESIQARTPVANPSALELRNLLVKSGSGLYPLPAYGAERAGGYLAPDPKAPTVLAGWWSLALGRRVSLQAQWPHHTKALRRILNRIGAHLVPRDVLKSPVS